MEEADIILINTCSVRDNAEQRIWGRLSEMRRLRRKKPTLLVGVIGCMAERLKEELLESGKGVDIVAGPDTYRDLPKLCREAEGGGKGINTLLSTEETYAEINNVILTNLESYAPDANDSSTFNAKHTKKNEKNIDELCAVEKAAGQDPSILEKWRNYSSIYEAYNNIFPDYFNNITEYGNKTAELVAYQVGLGYVKELCSVYEAFYKTFPEKVSTMVRRQDELVDALAFTKGDSVLNICATRPLLQELSRSTTSMSEEGSMLDSELNGQIFDENDLLLLEEDFIMEMV